MKGLLIKDLKLMMLQKRTIIILCLVAVFVIFSKGEPEFAVGYISIMFPMLTVTTISYDEFENGMAFLMTLPVSRKLYVREKYLSGILCMIGSTVASTIMALVCYLGIQHLTFSIDMLAYGIGSAAGSSLYFAVTLPMKMKFRAEKYSFVMFAAMGVIFVAVIGFLRVAETLHLAVPEAWKNALQVGPMVLLLMLAAVCMAAMLVSYCISIRIMEKKEF